MGVILMPDVAFGFLPRRAVVPSGAKCKSVTGSCLGPSPVFFTTVIGRKMWV